jgi:anti-anti-sigma factor
MVSGHAVYDDGVLRITRTCEQPGLAIAGEIDESTYAGLVEALAELAALPGEVHLSLASVEYCDLAGLRAIVGVTGGAGQEGGRRVVLHGVPPQLETVLQIVGWDATPGLLVDNHDGGVPQGAERAQA